MTISFRKQLLAKQLLWGTLISLPSAEIAEILADARFDWLFIDLEHSPMEFKDVQRILQAVGKDIAGIIRIPSNDDVWIKKALDIGAAGVMVPLVNSADDARQAVTWSKYPPGGSRSVGVGRAHRYGAALQATIDTANDETAVIVQVEHITAVENIDAIISVEGVDAVLIGPYDLSASMDIPGKVTDPAVQAAIEKVRITCQQQGMPVGIFTASIQYARDCARSGFTLIAVSTDTLLLVEAARSTLASLKA
ncbi:MAG TPA: aldolase/citrate lyase family protein [Leptolinea sp.]